MKRYIVSFLCVLSVSGIAYGQGIEKFGEVAISSFEKGSELFIKEFGSGLGVDFMKGVGSSMLGSGFTNGKFPIVEPFIGTITNKGHVALRNKKTTDNLRYTDISSLSKPLTFKKNPKWNHLAREYPSPRKVVVSSDPAKSLPDQNNQEIESETGRTSQDWKEGLRKRVYDKIQKINPMETMGDMHMIYGKILILNDDEENNSNYAA